MSNKTITNQTIAFVFAANIETITSTTIPTPVYKPRLTHLNAGITPLVKIFFATSTALFPILLTNEEVPDFKSSNQLSVMTVFSFNHSLIDSLVHSMSCITFIKSF
jgi:hypothetical protein